MPDLDVSFVLADAMFSDALTVTRRTDTIDGKGRTHPGSQLIPDLYGVVTQQDPADLMRNDDGQMMPRVIFIAAPFKFRGPSTGFQPDVINWNGWQYTVKNVLDYSRYGEGFTEVVAIAMTAIDPPP